jgi:hypothetical protein
MRKREQTEQARPKRTFIGEAQPNRWIWRQEIGRPRDSFGTLEAVRQIPIPQRLRRFGTEERPPENGVGALAAWRRRTSRGLLKAPKRP